MYATERIKGTRTPRDVVERIEDPNAWDGVTFSCRAPYAVDIIIGCNVRYPCIELARRFYPLLFYYYHHHCYRH